MIKLTIDDKEFKLASEWSDITFGQYINIADINKDEHYSELEKAIRIIAATSDKPEGCIKSLFGLDSDSFNQLATEFSWTNESIDHYKNNPKESISIDGRNYKIKKNYNKLTLGDMVSVETLLQDNKNLNPFEIAFGVLLREIKEDGSEIELTMESFTEVLTGLRDKVMLLDVYQHLVFFSTGANTYTENNTKAYSIQKI